MILLIVHQRPQVWVMVTGFFTWLFIHVIDRRPKPRRTFWEFLRCQRPLSINTCRGDRGICRRYADHGNPRTYDMYEQIPCSFSKNSNYQSGRNWNFIWSFCGWKQSHEGMTVISRHFISPNSLSLVSRYRAPGSKSKIPAPQAN